MAQGFRVTMAPARKTLIKRAERAFAKVNEDVLPQNFNAEMIDAKWRWPSSETTVRRNGETVATPRNIIDEGTLIDSYYRRKEGPSRYAHGWSAAHAAATHNGAALKNGGTIFPRPWSELPLQFLPEEFAKAFKNAS